MAYEKRHFCVYGMGINKHGFFHYSIDNGHIITHSRTLITYSTEISFKTSTDSGQLSVRLADSKQAEVSRV